MSFVPKNFLKAKCPWKHRRGLKSRIGQTFSSWISTGYFHTTWITERINEETYTTENLLMNKLPQENNVIDVKMIPAPTCAYSLSIAALFWLNALKERKKK